MYIPAYANLFFNIPILQHFYSVTLHERVVFTII